MLKALMLRRRIDLKKKDLAALREKLEGLNTREAELSQAIEEVETEEQRTAAAAYVPVTASWVCSQH